MKAITLLFFMNMFSGMGYSIVAPLFPTLGEKYNISESLLGWIISTYAISNSIITPFIPSLCKIFTRIKLLYFATFFEATCTFLYGFLQNISSYSTLLIIIFFMRIIHGICSAIIATLVYSITYSLSNENEIQSALGNIEIGLSIGTSCGPLFASFFYHLGGYPLPFIILGAFLYISVYLTSIVSNEKIDSENEVKEDPPFFKLLININILIIFFVFIFGMIALTFFFPCLTNHLTKNYNMDVSSSSLFFSVPVLAYFIVVQFLNFISNKIGLYCAMTMGFIFTNIGCIFVYPLPPIPRSIISIIIGLMLIGGGGPTLYVPGLIVLTNTVKKIYRDIDENTANDVSSSINNLSISIGDFIGPVLGGFLSSNFGFKYSCIIVSLILFIYFLIFVFYNYNNIKNDINNKFYSFPSTNYKENKEEKNDQYNNEDKLNRSYDFNINKFSLNFQYMRARKYSYQKNNKINLNNSLYTSLSN